MNCRVDARSDTRGHRDEAPHPASGSLKHLTNSQSVSAATLNLMKLCIEARVEIYLSEYGIAHDRSDG